MKKRVTKADAEHVVARICNVQEGESVITAAEKAIAIMREAGFPARDIRKAEQMLAQAKSKVNAS